MVLLHGFADTGDMWAPLAAELAKNHTVIVPDLRGMGLSAPAAAGTPRRIRPLDIAGVMDALKVQQADLITHDIGNMVGYALAVQAPTRITRWAVIDAPLPGIGDWDKILLSPILWHFNFRGPGYGATRARPRADLSRSVLQRAVGRPEEDRRGNPRALREALRASASDARLVRAVCGVHAGRDRQLGAARGASKPPMPVLALGAEKSFGTGQAELLRFAASNVTGGIVPNSGHWIMEENPQATIKLVMDFLGK